MLRMQIFLDTLILQTRSFSLHWTLGAASSCIGKSPPPQSPSLSFHFFVIEGRRSCDISADWLLADSRENPTHQVQLSLKT